MIFLKKDENERVTGGYKVTFGIVHKFFILQVLLVVLAVIFDVDMLFAFSPLLLIASLLAFPMFLGDIVGGILGVVKIIKKENVSFQSMIRSALITAQVLGWIFALLGNPLFGNCDILFFIYGIDLAISVLTLVFFLVITVISDLLLLVGLQKAGFALKSIFDKIAEYAAKKQEKEKAQ